jgi:predicted glycosyltransferase involved in capsule biosynthesis
MKISICTQIKNRLVQFEQTFIKNLEIIEKNTDIEWVIVDYNSTDGLSKYIKNYVEKFNFIKYYAAVECVQKYSIPVAKNFAARLSSGEFLFNLDCDNFLDNIIEEIRATDQGVFCHEYQKGTYGRIGLHKNIFVKIGGYDENFYPAAVHDNDLILRAKYLNYNFKNVPSISDAISNDKFDTVRYLENISYEKMKEYNEIIMKYNEKKKILNPNNDIFTPCYFVLNFKHYVKKTNRF